MEPNPPPPKIESLPPVIADAPPQLTDGPKDRTGTSNRAGSLAILLSLGLGVYLADALVSFADDSLALLTGRHLLAMIRGIVGLFSFLSIVMIYILTGVNRSVPKRFFLPLTLYDPVMALLIVLLMIYFYAHIQLISWVLSLGQVLLAVGILLALQGTLKPRWPLVPSAKLAPRAFSWKSVIGFVLVNMCVLLPCVLVYLFFCASLAVGHFSEGFMALGTDGISVIAKKYVRDDGKTIQLFPMAHVGEADFYAKISKEFPTDSIILMEGVTDDKHLLTNKLSYKKMAKTLGLSEQKETFEPKQGEVVRADIDIGDFSKSTIDFLNMATMFHTRGLDPETVTKMMTYKPPPGLETQLVEELLIKRNQHLMGEIKSHLKESDHLVVPWGAAHIPGIAREIQGLGFHATESQRYVVIRFGGKRGTGKTEPQKPQGPKE